eukprot:464501-Rhodomonas_salina.4
MPKLFRTPGEKKRRLYPAFRLGLDVELRLFKLRPRHSEPRLRWSSGHVHIRCVRSRAEASHVERDQHASGIGSREHADGTRVTRIASAAKAAATNRILCGNCSESSGSCI